MIKSEGLLDFGEKSSLIRSLFNQDFDLQGFNFPEIQIPRGFKSLSFIPGKNGIDLLDQVDRLKSFLKKNNISDTKYKRIVPGIIEAIKNAYEHGNLKDNSKKIYWHQKISPERDLEVFVGDEGGKVNGNLFSYALSLKGKSNSQIDSSPDFYSFQGGIYAPFGHSGVGTKVMNRSFERVKYFKNKDGGLTVYLAKSLNH